jgi:hypothetical protein
MQMRYFYLTAAAIIVAGCATPDPTIDLSRYDKIMPGGAAGVHGISKNA